MRTDLHMWINRFRIFFKVSNCHISSIASNLKISLRSMLTCIIDLVKELIPFDNNIIIGSSQILSMMFSF